MLRNLRIQGNGSDGSDQFWSSGYLAIPYLPRGKLTPADPWFRPQMLDERGVIHLHRLVSIFDPHRWSIAFS